VPLLDLKFLRGIRRLRFRDFKLTALAQQGRGFARSAKSRHPPRKRGIQYAAAFDSITDVSEYWITRRSLSSGGAMRRPGGG
jgi:hypothetical protein